jgi:hypothetical protein
MQALNEMIVIGTKQSNIIINLKKECKGFIFLEIGIATNGLFCLVRDQPIVKNLSSQNIN